MALVHGSRSRCIVWLSDNTLNSWRAPPSGTTDGQCIYTDIAIEVALTIRMVLHLPLRQTEGFLRSLTDMLDVEIPVPDHTTLSRRLKKLGKIPYRAVAIDRPIHLLIDRAGLRMPRRPSAQATEAEGLAEAAPRGQREYERDRCLGSDRSSDA